VLTEEKSDYIGARLEHTPRKSLKRLAQEIGMSKSSARAATERSRFETFTIPYGICSRKSRNELGFLVNLSVHAYQYAVQLNIITSVINMQTLIETLRINEIAPEEWYTAIICPI
jgi:hypothetical protein